MNRKAWKQVRKEKRRIRRAQSFWRRIAREDQERQRTVTGRSFSETYLQQVPNSST